MTLTVKITHAERRTTKALDLQDDNGKSIATILPGAERIEYVYDTRSLCMVAVATSEDDDGPAPIVLIEAINEQSGLAVEINRSDGTGALLRIGVTCQMALRADDVIYISEATIKQTEKTSPIATTPPPPAPDTDATTEDPAPVDESDPVTS